MEQKVKDPIVRKALAGLLVMVVSGAAAAGALGYEANQREGSNRLVKQVATAAWQYGPQSPETANLAKQAAAQTAFLAVVDPATGQVDAAGDPSMVGKKLNELTLPDGVKLPALEQLPPGGRLPLIQPDGKRVNAQLLPVFAGGQMGARGEGFKGARGGEGRFQGDRRGEGHFQGDRRSEGRGNRGGRQFGPRGAAPAQAQPGAQAPAPAQAAQPAAKPVAYLLTINKPFQVTPLLIVGGVLAAVSGLGLLYYWLSVAWWAYSDAKRRNRCATGWGLLVLLTNLVGVAAYLLTQRCQERRERRLSGGDPTIV